MYTPAPSTISTLRWLSLLSAEGGDMTWRLTWTTIPQTNMIMTNTPADMGTAFLPGKAGIAMENRIIVMVLQWTFKLMVMVKKKMMMMMWPFIFAIPVIYNDFK